MPSKNRKYKRYARRYRKMYKIERYKRGLGPTYKQEKPEMHHLDVAAISVTPSSTVPTVTVLNDVAEGLTNQDRIGAAITMLSVSLRLGITQNISATFTRTRLVVVYDRFPNGTDPAYTDVFTVSGINAFRNLNNTGRFVIVYNRIFQTSDANTEELPVIINRKLFKKRTQFVSGTVTCQRGGLYLMCATDEGTNAPTVSGASRVMFYCN